MPKEKSFKQKKIETLVKHWGFKSEKEYIEGSMFSSIVGGICNNPDCDYTTDVEPDQDRGYCEICGTRTVKSGLILTGIL